MPDPSTFAVWSLTALASILIAAVAIKVQWKRLKRLFSPEVSPSVRRHAVISLVILPWTIFGTTLLLTYIAVTYLPSVFFPDDVLGPSERSAIIGAVAHEGFVTAICSSISILLVGFGLIRVLLYYAAGASPPICDAIDDILHEFHHLTGPLAVHAYSGPS